ncbi:MAG: PEP/pyruvate-binding domain-containing protein [Blastocatellia bacterium]|nr:PEP/pyruvate-binding domain-containing protein [Blastocatellia bacterium]
MRKILWLDQVECRKKHSVGGKAANLSFLSAYFPVPYGFCLTTDAFNLLEEISTRSIVGGLYQQVEQAYNLLCKHVGVDNVSVAVRSSAIVEDGDTASFAGQYKTYLNVVGLESVIEAITDCWQAIHNSGTDNYLKYHKMDERPLEMAVLVQQMVIADISVVAFSANPLNGSREEILINANWGLGESIVSGIVTPDTYTVRKKDFFVVSRHIGEKQIMTIASSNGTEKISVPRIMRKQAVLDESKIREIAETILFLEEVLGYAVDIESVYKGSRLYLLQCRPITSNR